MLDGRETALLFALVDLLVQTYPELASELSRLTNEYKTEHFHSGAILQSSITNALHKAGIWNVY